jgi:hypothetical protein
MVYGGGFRECWQGGVRLGLAGCGKAGCGKGTNGAFYFQMSNA